MRLQGNTLQAINPPPANIRKPSIWERPILLLILTIVFGNFVWLGTSQLDLPPSWEWPSKLVSFSVAGLMAMLVMPVFRLQR
jgi:hypothetical protein